MTFNLDDRLQLRLLSLEALLHIRMVIAVHQGCKSIAITKYESLEARQVIRPLRPVTGPSQEQYCMTTP